MKIYMVDTSPRLMSSSILVRMFWPPLLLDLLLLLLCRYSLLRAFHKTQNEKQSVETWLWSAIHRGSRSSSSTAAAQQHSSSTAAAQQQHSSSSGGGGGGGGGGAAAAAASSPSESRAGCCVVSPLPSVFVLFLCVCTSGCRSLPWLRGFGLGIRLGACRPIVWTAEARMNLERSSVQIVRSSGKFCAVFVKFVQFSSFVGIF